MKLRLLALLPTLFLAHVAWDYLPDQWPHLLWMCQLANVLLAVGLLFRHALSVQVATVWLIIGLPLWLVDLAATGEFFVHSIGTHLASPVLGLYALRQLPPARSVVPAALSFVLASQLLGRALTPPELNINVAHQVMPWMRWAFSSFAAYTVSNWVLAAVAVTAVNAAVQDFLRQDRGIRRDDDVVDASDDASSDAAAGGA